MVEEAGIGKREPIGHYGKPLYGRTPVQDVTKVICLVPKITMDVISDKHHNTMRDYAFPRL